jgi:hypothetical protein
MAANVVNSGWPIPYSSMAFGAKAGNITRLRVIVPINNAKKIATNQLCTLTFGFSDIILSP